MWSFHINRRRKIKNSSTNVLPFYILPFVYMGFDALFLYFTIIKMTKKMAMYNVLWHVNQFDVRIDNKNYFYSYNSLCVIIDWDSSTIIFGRDWDYSRTTLKHLYAFMDDNYLSTLDNKKTIQKAIEDGKIGDYRVYFDNEMH